MAKESVLNAKDKESFEIERFIFHVIRKDNPLGPDYLDEVNLDEEQIKFFKARFGEIAAGTQCEFVDKEKSGFYKDCKALLENSQESFIKKSKDIAYDFHNKHIGNTNDGVFIISIVKVNNSTRLIFLLKLDNIKVYRYNLSNKKALLEEIKNTFVEYKKTIQKSALINISDDYKWDVLALERESVLRDYFKNFLTVRESQTHSKLTIDSVSAVGQWAKSNKIDLDPTQGSSSYKSRAIHYMECTTLFDTDLYIDAVISDEDEIRKERLKVSLNNFLSEKGISGQVFEPKPKSLGSKDRKNALITAENVKIEWEGDEKAANIEIVDKEKNKDGRYHIIIKTNSLGNI